ncbi:MlaE family ABC transporter permease [Elusimicrobiota bacterium]
MAIKVSSITDGFLYIAEEIGGAAYFIRNVFFALFRKPDDINNIFKQMVRVGVDSLPIVILSALFTGMVLALQSGVASIKVFDEAIFIGTLVSFAIVLELGPVLTALVISGRIGASITAELGTMKVSEQLDALYMLGTTPEKYLAAPLFIAMLIMLPAITLLADVTGVWGGYLISVTTFDVPGGVYTNDVLTHLQIVHFVHGLIKSVFFAFIIVSVSCYRGFKTAGGAEGVGKSTTRAVVLSMVLILVSDYFLSTLLNAMGLM